METEQPQGNTRTVVLVITTLVTFMVPFMTAGVNIALPEIGSEFAMNAVVLGWVATAYFLASSSLLVPFGRLADIYGRRKIFAAGAVIFALGSILCIISRSEAFFIGSRALQGIGGAMLLSTSIAMLTSVYPMKQRGNVLGINAGAAYLGLSAGPVIGGFLTSHAGWRSIFWLGFAIPFITVVVVLWKLRSEWAGAKGERFDYGGSAIFAVSLIALIYGLTSLPDVLGAVLTLAGVMGFIAFAWWESHAGSPLIQLDLFKNNHAFVFSSVATIISYAATYAVTFLISLYLQYNKGLSPEKAGLVLLGTPAVQSVFSPIVGRLSDRIEPRILASAGMAVCTLGLGMLMFVAQDTSLGYLVASLLVLGVGLGLFASPNTNALMSSASKQWYGVASAALATSRQVGVMLSMGITMLMLSTFVGRVVITPPYYGRFVDAVRIAFIVFTVLCFIGIFASLARGNVHKVEPGAQK
ncbi:MAG: MFS transporter [Dehalococcoidia bacterium]|nr:MFS transporter [Dehalococcoidia bacterium]